MYVFFIENDKLLEKYNKIWDKISISFEKGFDRKPKEIKDI